jgi:predicted phosphodiesterase
MRYALISDIHSNLEALRAVLDFLSGEKIDEYLCLGDIVGYGADPKDCISIVRSLKPSAFISGNHEWGVAGLLELEYFNEYAREAIIWTRKALRKDDITYLKSSRLICEFDTFTLVHGGLVEPSKFPYIMDSDDASSTMGAAKTRLCFVGHTHVAEIYTYCEGKARSLEGYNIRCEKGKRYLINTGSVGQPRDMDPRAGCCIYDTGPDTIEIKRIPYDFKITQKKIRDAGLPAMLALRLSEGR